jgi:hypothetical protein
MFQKLILNVEWIAELLLNDDKQNEPYRNTDLIIIDIVF